MDAKIAIVGAGPIGLELAVALKQRGISYLHFDAQQIGHTISWFAPQTRFFSSNERIAIAGVPLLTADQLKATREEYLTYLRRVVEQYDLQINTYEPVANIQRQGDGFVLTTHPTAGEKKYHVEKVVLATGGTAMPNRLNIPGEELPHVSHYFEDPHKFFRRKVLVVGGKNSAAEAAVRCYHAGAKVAVSYRGEQYSNSIKYWLLPEINGLIESGGVTAFFQTRPVRITPEHVVLEQSTGKTLEVPADFVLLMTGYLADMSLFTQMGVQLQEDRRIPVFNEQTMETNISGLYVAGTAAAGTQHRYALFLENCHIHVQRIVASICGAEPPAAGAPVFARPET